MAQTDLSPPLGVRSSTVHGLPAAAHQLVSTQYGLITPAQLEATGLTTSQIRHLVRRGQLVRYPGLAGVYRSPSVPDSERARCAAACLARPGAVVSGPTAGRWWGFRRLPDDRRIHVLIPENAARPDAPWVSAHRCASLAMRQVTAQPGLAVLAPLDTVVDLAPFLTDADLESVLAQALGDRRTRPEDVNDHLRALAHARVRGATRVLAMTRAAIPGGPAESHGEVQVIAALRAAGISGLVGQFAVSLPEFGAVRFDLAVPEARWAVEIDLHPTHFDRHGASRDAARDRAAAAAGWVVRRIVADDMVSLPHLADRLRRELDTRRALLARRAG
ncbi:MAG: type IV toxin-antitoxin system AbiEi family antitoxin domain-containing protein [Actinomycetota bacterium]